MTIMGPDEPSRELQELLVSPVLERRAKYVKGSIMKENDLERVDVENATACLVFSDW